jgi:hypothetical protein
MFRETAYSATTSSFITIGSTREQIALRQRIDGNGGTSHVSPSDR